MSLSRAYRHRFGFWDELHIPFNHNAPMPPGGIQVMERCCTALEELNLNYFLTDGTLLGLIREGRFIPHDNDIDVNIIGEAEFKEIHSMFLRKLGMTLGRKTMYRRRIQQLIYYTADRIIFDMVFWKVDGDNIKNYAELGFMREQPYSFYRKPGEISFCGKTYPVPFPVDEWLAMRFGADWRIPKVSKGNWMDDCFDLKRI